MFRYEMSKPQPIGDDPVDTAAPFRFFVVLLAGFKIGASLVGLELKDSEDDLRPDEPA